MKKTTNHVICEDIEGKTYSVPITELSFRPAAYGVIVQDGKILLSKCWDGYDFPGGGINIGEHTEAAVAREVHEETGLEVKVENILHTNSSFFKLPFDGNFVHSLHLYFACQVIGGELSTDFFDEHEQHYASMAEWIELDEVKNIKIYSSTDPMNILKQYKMANEIVVHTA